MAASTDLPDLNVWLALAVGDHPFHGRARRYWEEEAGERLAFCRLTALGLLRLLTNPAVLGGEPFTVAEAWGAYAALRRLPEIVVAEEPRACERILAGWARDQGFPARAWTDAYLAAFARSGRLRLVSFDADFARFAGLELLRLEV